MTRADTSPDHQAASRTPPVTDDTGLRCPRCEYNLTGLAQPRCPECGAAFDWDRVRREAANPPRIYFERVRGRHLILGYLVTAGTVLFAPWIFARQIVQRVSLRRALLFVCVCFALTLPALMYDFTPDVYVTWLLTAACYIIIQTLWLGVLDFPGWRRPVHAWRFWLAAGCYTSAIMPTEFFGPPILLATALAGALGLGNQPSYMDEVSEYLFKASWGAALSWAQIAMWLWGLVFCYRARLRTAGCPELWSVVAAIAVGISLLCLYAGVISVVGVTISGAFI